MIKEEWRLMTDNWWMMMISSYWGALQMVRQTNGRLKIRLYYPPFSQIFSLRKTFNSVVLLKFVVVWRYSPLTVNKRLFPLISIYMKQDKTELTIKYHQLHLLHTRLFYELSICKNQNQIFFSTIIIPSVHGYILIWKILRYLSWAKIYMLSPKFWSFLTNLAQNLEISRKLRKNAIKKHTEHKNREKLHNLKENFQT